MKKVVFAIMACLILGFCPSQNKINVNGETLTVNQDVEGELDLLWTVSDGTYRYFVKTASEDIYELTNTKDSNNKYNEEYKTILAELTASKVSSVDRVKLTLPSLRSFFNTYNSLKDSNYVAKESASKVNFRLGLFGGITNHPFIENIGNSSYGQLAAELEIFGNTDNPRHSGIFQVRQTIGSNEDYTTTELSLGYRFRVVRKEKFNLFVQNKFGTLNFGSSHLRHSESTGNFNVPSDTFFDVPFSFGLGADIKISENSFISIVYDSLLGLNVDDSGNFSTDILVGYKFNL